MVREPKDTNRKYPKVSLLLYGRYTGVPQGSILGPFHLCFMGDILEYNKVASQIFTFTVCQVQWSTSRQRPRSKSLLLHRRYIVRPQGSLLCRFHFCSIEDILEYLNVVSQVFTFTVCKVQWSTSRQRLRSKSLLLHSNTSSI